MAEHKIVARDLSMEFQALDETGHAERVPVLEGFDLQLSRPFASAVRLVDDISDFFVVDGGSVLDGANLARLEITVMFDTLLDRIGEIELAVPREQLAYRPSSFTSGLEGLPIRFAPA